MSEQDADLIPLKMMEIAASLQNTIIGYPLSDERIAEHMRSTIALRYGCKPSEVKIFNGHWTDDHEWVCNVSLPLTTVAISFTIT